MSPTLDTGRIGERVAERSLIDKGYRLLHRNWRYKNHHEIDLICISPEDDLVAVEVRTHASPQEYEPFESIQTSKILRLKRALEIYAEQNASTASAMRIDVVSIILEPEQIEHFEAVDLHIN